MLPVVYGVSKLNVLGISIANMEKNFVVREFCNLLSYSQGNVH